MAYEFRLAHEVRERKGSFLLDFLNFERTTVVTGWRFEALVVVRDGLVLFRNFGANPTMITSSTKPIRSARCNLVASRWPAAW